MLRVSCFKVKPGQVERLRSWLHALNDRADEVRDTFRQETVRHEQALLIDTRAGPVLIYAIEAEDHEAGRAAYESSTLAIDQEHREVMEAVLDGPADVERIYDVALE